MPRDPFLVGAPISGGGLPERRAHSSYAATAMIPRVIAGHNRAFYEHATGQKVTNGQPIVAPKNMRGLVGEDHGGGIFGKPIKHTYYAMDMAPSYGGPAGGPGNTGRIDVTSQYQPFTGMDEIMEVPCPGGEAYKTARIDAFAYVNQAPGGGYAYLYLYPDGSTEHESLAFPLISTGYKTDSHPSFPMKPGYLNRIRFKFYIGGTSSVSLDVELHGIAFSQNS